MIKFRYKVPDNLVPLMVQTIVEYSGDYIIGYLEENLSGQLRHTSLYLVCELEFINDVQVYKNPLAIVSRNDTEAVLLYNKVTGKDNGAMICEIVNRCDNIKVEPV